ncbi:hypothetical protein Droror1_Dr00003170 [Drosera rotundifolia]
MGLNFVKGEAKKYGIKLILSLVNNCDGFGGKKQYLTILATQIEEPSSLSQGAARERRDRHWRCGHGGKIIGGLRRITETSRPKLGIAQIGLDGVGLGAEGVWVIGVLFA